MTKEEKKIVDDIRSGDLAGHDNPEWVKQLLQVISRLQEELDTFKQDAEDARYERMERD